MTEQEWFASDDPAGMLTVLKVLTPESQRGPALGRKLRLFARACCRLNGSDSEGVDVYEQTGFIDDLREKCRDSEWARVWIATGAGVAQVTKSVILRDIIGNPFRPVDKEALVLRYPWELKVKPLAQSIYNDRAFDLMPVLADAMEEAGCTDAAILDHCRGPGPHVRGCWVLDLILGKS